MRKAQVTKAVAGILSAVMAMGVVPISALATANNEQQIVKTTIDENNQSTNEVTQQEAQVNQATASATTQAEESHEGHNHAEDGSELNIEVVQSDWTRPAQTVQPVAMSMMADTTTTSASIPNNGKFKVDPLTLFNSDASTSANNWTVYSHYELPNSGWSNTATAPSDWNTKYNQDSKHNWYPAFAGGTNFYDLRSAENYTDATGQSIRGSSAWLSESKSVKNVSDHIFVSENAKGDAAMTFLGYYTGDFTDWALAPIKEEFSQDVKTVSFDIDASEVSPHTLRSYGVLVNAGVDNGLLKGYAVYFSPHRGEVYLVDMTEGLDAEQLHDSQTATKNNQSPAYYIGGAGKSYVYGDVRSESHQPYDLVNGARVASQPIQAGKPIPSQGKFHVYTEFNDDYLTVKVFQLDASGGYDQDNPYIQNTFEFDGTTYRKSSQNGFGLYADYYGYVGDGHTCTQLSYVTYSNLDTTFGLALKFRDSNGDVYLGELGGFPVGSSLDKMKQEAIEKGDTESEAYYTLPVLDPVGNKVFKEWNTKIDGTGDKYDPSMLLNAPTTVYAIWVDAGIDVTYSTTDWTNKPVEVTFDVISPVKPKEVTLSNGGTVEYVDGGNGKYTYKTTISKNDPKLTVTAEVEDSQGKKTTLTENSPVTNIDVVKPTITIDPTLEGKNITDPTMIQNKVTFDDPDLDRDGYVSKVNDSTKVVIFTPVKGGDPIEINFNDLGTKFATVPGGEYNITVKVKDNAGNETETEKPIKSYVNVTDPDVKPAITVDGNNYQDSTWTTRDVKVSVDFEGGGAPLKTIKENNDSKNVSNEFENNTFTVTKEGKYVYDWSATNIFDNSKTSSQHTILIDKTAPILSSNESVTKDKVFNADSFTVADPTPRDVNAISGLDESGTTITFVEIINGKPSGTSTTIPYNNKSNISNLKEGQKYQVTFKMKDNAGNVATEVVDNVTFIKDPAAALVDKSVTLKQIKSDKVGSTVLDVISQKYPIKSVSMKDSTGKVTELYNIMTDAGLQSNQANGENAWRVQVPTKNATLIVNLQGGSSIELNYEAGQTAGTESTLIAGSTTPTMLSAIPTYVSAMRWMPANVAPSSYTIEVKTGNNYAVKTEAQLTALVKRVNQNIVICVKGTDGKNYYVGENGKVSTNRAEVGTMTIPKQ